MPLAENGLACFLWAFFTLSESVKETDCLENQNQGKPDLFIATKIMAYCWSKQQAWNLIQKRRLQNKYPQQVMSCFQTSYEELAILWACTRYLNAHCRMITVTKHCWAWSVLGWERLFFKCCLSTAVQSNTGIYIAVGYMSYISGYIDQLRQAMGWNWPKTT